MQVFPGTAQALETANPKLLLGSARVLSLVRSIRLMHAPLREPVGCHLSLILLFFLFFYFYVFATLTDDDTDRVSINVFVRTLCSIVLQKECTKSPDIIFPFVTL